MRNDPCVEWTGYRKPTGYGVVGVPGRGTLRAHRFAYELEYGPIPDGMVVMHKCDNPPCVNVDHLTLGTQADNNRDRAAKGRSADTSGERNPSAKLTDTQRAEIREKFVREYEPFCGPRMRSNTRELMQEYNVSRATVVKCATSTDERG